MWARPAVVWMVHGVFAGGGLYVVMCDELHYRALVFCILMAIRIGWTRLILRHAADAKFAAVLELARSRHQH